MVIDSPEILCLRVCVKIEANTDKQLHVCIYIYVYLYAHTDSGSDPALKVGDWSRKHPKSFGPIHHS